MYKKKILVLAGTPPPLHGEALMNKRLLESKFSESFDILHVQYRFAESISDIGVIRIKKIIKFILYIFQTIIILIKNKIDVIYRPIVPKGLPFIRDAIILIIVNIFGTPYILHLHGKGIKEGYNKSSLFRRYLYRRVFGRAIGVIYLGKSNIKDTENLVSRDNIYVVPNGIPDLPKRSNDRESNKGIQKILFLSHMMKEKGPLILLKTLPRVKKIIPRVRYIFVGEWSGDDCKMKFFEFIKKNNLSDFIEYKGRIIDENEKDELFHQSSIFVFPTYLPETFGTVNVEAMRAGLPVISTDSGAIPEVVINGVTGYIVPPKDSQKLAEKIIELLKNPDKAKKMGIAGRKRFEENYTIEIFEKNMIDVVNKILIRNT